MPSATPDPLTNAQRVAQQQQQEPETHAIPATPPPQGGMTFEPDPIGHNLTSPFSGMINDADWTMFAYLFEDDSNSVSPNWLLGHFKIGARRLQDLGMMKDIRQADYNGKKVWEGNFVEPLSMQIFINDPKMQYDTFVKEIKFLMDGITKRGLGGMPISVHGNDVSMSGLLAIAKFAGLDGMDSFIKNSGDWDKFPSTRDIFLKANGIF